MKKRPPGALESWHEHCFPQERIRRAGVHLHGVDEGCSLCYELCINIWELKSTYLAQGHPRARSRRVRLTSLPQGTVEYKQG